MKRLIFALLALLVLITAIGCPPKGDDKDKFGPGPTDRVIDDTTEDQPVADDTPPADTTGGTETDGTDPGDDVAPDDDTGEGGEEPEPEPEPGPDDPG